MSSLVKYGKYFISAGIAIGGAVWLQRPGDLRVKGEDIADLYGAVQDCYVVPYLVGDALPDWKTANEGETTTVTQAIQYYDIQTIAHRSRELWNKNSNIFWTTNTLSGDTIEPSKMLGGYAFTNTDYGIVDELNSNGLMVTNRYYTYSTNTFSDNLLTTATRIFTPGMKLEQWTTGDQWGWMTTITPTNLPVSGYVFSGAQASKFEGLTSYTSWPFEWSFTYPWEQWSYTTKSRVSVFQINGENINWTNVVWIATNSLGVAFTPSLKVSGKAGYSMACFRDLAGHMSVPFAYVVAPPANNDIYLYASNVNRPTDLVRNLVWSPTWNNSVAVKKDNTAYGQELAFSVVAGDVINVRNGAYNDVVNFVDITPPWAFVNGQYVASTTNSFSVVKFWIPAKTNISPIYLAISVRQGDPVKTNYYFTVSGDLATLSTPSGTATTNAVTKTFKATDDLRISTNKLNGLAQIITNMNRTVYFGGIGTLIATNRVCKRTDTFWNGQANIYYVTEWLSGNTEQDPQYYDFGDPAQYIPTYIATAGTDTFTNTNWSVREIYSERLQYVAYKKGQRYSFAPDPGGGWNGYSSIEGQSYEKLEYSYTGVTPVYPSMFAVTNGYVKKVTVYALYEVRTAWQPSYLAGQYYYMGDSFSHDVGGNYWTTYNTGLEISGKTLSTPTEALPDTRVKYLHRDYATAIKNRAVYCKIAEVSNPTSQIFFDIDRSTVTAMNFASQHAYSFSTEEDGVDDNWEERFTWDYSGGAEVNTVQFLVVVDWNFQHLGRGFTP